VVWVIDFFMSISSKEYIEVLQPWAKAMQEHLYIPTDRPDLLCYGTGYDNWGVQTNQKALASLAVLATSPHFDEKKACISRRKLLDQCLKMLRFSLESHIEGSYHRTDGAQWGHTWISVLGIERMMHGVEAIENHLTDDDQKQLKRMLVSESDWILDHYNIVAGPYAEEGNNKPESNLWNGAILHRVAMMFPDTPRVAAYRKKGTQFLVNSISVPGDKTSKKIYDGRPVSKWHMGSNFMDSYALTHHQYLNVGYMVICLSNMAMLHYAYKTHDVNPPEALYHHGKDLWKVVKRFVFPDGRLLRIGGDSRVRYCYCQDYLIPALLMIGEHFDDPDASALEEGWLKQVATERKANADGAFLSERCTALYDRAPMFYTRLEADRAVTLSMGAYWRDRCDIPNKLKKTTGATGSWKDNHCGALFERGEKRAASWTWYAAELPQGLCLPVDGSNMAEWHENLAGEIRGINEKHINVANHHKEHAFNGGFLTYGAMQTHSEGAMESHYNEILADSWIVFAALPDEATVAMMQIAAVPDRRVFLNSVKGLYLNVPNDLFNRNTRKYYTAKGVKQIKGVGSKETIIDLKSRWLNIEDKLGVIGVYGPKSLQVYSPGRRQINLRHTTHEVGTLFCNEICYPGKTGLTSYDANESLYDIGVVLQAGLTHTQTARTRTSKIATGHETARAMKVRGADKQDYLLVSNHGPKAAMLSLKGLKVAGAKELVSGKTSRCDSSGIIRIKLQAQSARVFLLG